MTTNTAPRVVTPSAVLAFARNMELLQAQVAQQFAPINEAIKAVQVAAIPGLNAVRAIQQQAVQLTRAHVFLVEQYQKSAKAKRKKAHAHLVAVCQKVASKLRRFVSLREVAAEFYKHTTEDTRTQLRGLLSEQNLANAPNALQSFLMTSHLEVAITT